MFARDDGLWDDEARLTDTKTSDARLAAGIRSAGDPIHDMRLCVTIDTRMDVLAASAVSDRVPYPGQCEAITHAYAKLVGLNLMRGFKWHVAERVGGTAGCTHLTELAAVLPTAAVQAFAGEVFRSRRGERTGSAGETEERPFQLDRCNALRLDGEAVRLFYPRWYRPEATGNDPSQPVTNTVATETS